MNSRYITFPLVADAQALIQRAFEFMQTKFIGWVPAEGNLDTAIIESVAGEGADVAALTTQVPKTIFGYIGQTMFDVPVLSATTALFHSTWNLSDNLGHTIVAGTQIGIRNTTGDLIPFMVLTDVIVTAGTVATATGAVTCVAINTGSDANGLGVIGGVVELIDPLAWVDNIVQTDIPDGGTDGETADAYLDRLSMKLKTIAPRPIIPRDFEIMARDIAGVQRATAIDGLDITANTTGNEKTIGLFALDATGQPISPTLKTDVETYLESQREINFNVQMGDASLHRIGVNVHVQTLPGWATADVAARVVLNLENYLNPARWSPDPTDNPNAPVTWVNDGTIRYLELAQVVNLVPGVRYVTTGPTVGAAGGSLSAADYSLSGRAPLPYTNPGDVVCIAT